MAGRDVLLVDDSFESNGPAILRLIEPELKLLAQLAHELDVLSAFANFKDLNCITGIVVVVACVECGDQKILEFLNRLELPLLSHID